MPKRTLITIILLLFLFAASAQKKLNYLEADKKSHELFNQQKWHELIEFSGEVRSQGIDFFYLQARTGIAYYNLKKYRKATGWFLKAWENDQSFEWLQEYLYYSLVYSGRSIEATKYAANFTNNLKSKIGFSYSKITRFAAEGGFSFNPDFEELTNGSLGDEANVGDDYGEAFYLENYNFESFDLSHQILPGFNLFHNITILSSNREQQVDWGERFTFPIKIRQYQYFINPSFVLGRKIYVSPSLSVVWGNFDLFMGANSNSIKYFYSSPQNFSDIIFSTSVWSHFGNFSSGAEINLANIYNKSFTQLSAWVTVYPFSNTSFYFTPRVYFKSDSETGLNYNTFGIAGGAQLGPVHFNGQYLVGDMKNFIEAAGYVISNFPGTSDSKFTGSLYFPQGKKYQFVVRYINQEVTETYRVYSSDVEINSVNYNFIKHTITGGISWKF